MNNRDRKKRIMIKELMYKYSRKYIEKKNICYKISYIIEGQIEKKKIIKNIMQNNFFGNIKKERKI